MGSKKTSAALVMLSIVWTDRRAFGDDCTISLAEFLSVNEGEWPEVAALEIGESVKLDWSTVTRVADGSPRVEALSDEESRRLDAGAWL